MIHYSHALQSTSSQSLTHCCVRMEDLVASLAVRIAKYSENLKQLVEDMEVLRVKGKLVRDIDDVDRRISRLVV